MAIITSLLVGIIAAIAIGKIVGYVINLTIKWIINKVKEKMTKKTVKKVAVADIEQLINECDNTVSLKDLVDEGYTHMMAEVGYDGKIVGDVDVIKDKNDSIDKDVEELINRTNEGMVIVER